MGVIGAELGGTLGGALGQRFGGSAGGDIGRVLGKIGGGLFPYFKNGGPVKKTGLAMVHKNEYVLPAGVKPTKAQRAAVAKKKGNK
jgi:outer membrane lipoprotein SlyB